VRPTRAALGGILFLFSSRGATVRPAVQQIGNGETYDFEFTPTVAGPLRLDVTTGNFRFLLASMPLRVLPAQ
jgi:hypothetical protein